jgi:hypothetical protein
METRYCRWGTCLMRFVFRDNLMFEEKFTSDFDWVPTADLSRPFYRDDTDLVELTLQEARQFEPRAFED